MAVDVADRVTQSDRELHVGLPIPRNTAKQIHNWVKDQQWPEGTELEHPSEYHITLLYTPEGHEHKDSWWLDHMTHVPKVRIKGFESFPGGPDGVPYILKIDSPEIEEHATMLQHRAEAMGLPITHFEGGYTPHLTVGYGPVPVTGLKAPNFEFDVGPSAVSPIRPPKEELPEKLSEYAPWDPDAEYSEAISIRQVAMLYNAGQGSMDELLHTAGYPTDEITLVAAVQTAMLLEDSGASGSEDSGPQQRDISPGFDQTHTAAREHPALFADVGVRGVQGGESPVIVTSKSTHSDGVIGPDVDVLGAARQVGRTFGTRSNVLDLPAVQSFDVVGGGSAQSFVPAEMTDGLVGVVEDDESIHGHRIVADWGDNLEPEDWELPGFQPWTQGFDGKGLINHQGQLLTWRTNEYGEPHHDVIAGDQNFPFVAKVRVDPDGSTSIPSPDVMHLFGVSRGEAEQHLQREAPQQGLRFAPRFSAQIQTRCLNCHSPLIDGQCLNCSTVPTQVNNPDDHWNPGPLGEPPDKKHDVQISSDWLWKA